MAHDALWRVLSHTTYSPPAFSLFFGLSLCRSGLVGWWYAVPVVADTALGIVDNAEGRSRS